MINNKIKVVFWDLDDTLWKGTLAENDDVLLLETRVETVKSLNKRGIVNSICSKNNYENAKKKLIEFGVWDSFVFAQIAFCPKGEMIKQALLDMHLRAENALFIDDNDINLREVEFYNPSISVLNVEDIDSLLDNQFLQGKDDSCLSRLIQYKQLEQKLEQRKNYSSNTEFLRNSNIKISEITVGEDNFDRLVELTERTNQLNFTKNRMNADELQTMLNDCSIKTRLIQVVDNYGDYGLAGFYSIREGRLVHFVFSCRIMNMGVEQYVYQMLGAPEINIVGGVASELSVSPYVDWIKLIGGEDETNFDEYSIERALDESSRIQIFGLGACDLYHPIAYFSMPNQYFVYECNVFKDKERGVNVGTEYIRSIFEMDADEKNYCKEHFYNYTGHLAFNSQIFQKNWDYVVLSFHDDIILKIYEKKDCERLRVLLSPARKYGDTSIINIDCSDYEGQRRWLAKEFVEKGYISAERFKDNIRWLISKSHKNTKFILINAPEINFFRKNNPEDQDVRNQILVINKALTEITSEFSDRIALVNINNIIKTKDDVTDYVFHLKANTAYNLFVEVLRTMVKYFPNRKESMLHRVKKGREIVIYGNGGEARNAFYNLLLGGEKTIKYVHHDYFGKKVGTMMVEDSEQIKGEKDKIYVVVADAENKADIVKRLMLYGFLPIEDFVIWKPLDYKKVWKED